VIGPAASSRETSGPVSTSPETRPGLAP
jgi:hypothetical protein